MLFLILRFSFTVRDMVRVNFHFTFWFKVMVSVNFRFKFLGYVEVFVHVLCLEQESLVLKFRDYSWLIRFNLGLSSELV